MKGGLTWGGRRLEFGTSVKLAGLLIMCDVWEVERWSERAAVEAVSKLADMFFRYTASKALVIM